jgi:cysteine synthase
MSVLFPTFDELRNPASIDPSIRARAETARTEDPLNPINYFNIHWRKPGTNDLSYFVMPKSLTNVDAEIVVLVAKDFPTGSHKVGPAYSVMAEKYVNGDIEPGKHTLVFPSTGNYGIGGSWVGPRAGFKSMVILPEGMSRERFEMIEGYGATYTKTYGSESNVKEIYDECNRLERQHPDSIRIMNQFSEMGNYRFHYTVTGDAIIALEKELSEKLGTRGISGYCSAMGSAGTIAAGDRVKQAFPNCRIVGLEPVQCPTLYNNGYGSHEIQGIGDKHVTWIHHVTNMDALACIDDVEALRITHVFTREIGGLTMMRDYGLTGEQACDIAGIFGISGVCNLIGAIKTARHYGLGKKDVVVTVATDNNQRYESVMKHWDAEHSLNEASVNTRIGGILRHQKTDYMLDGTPENRRRWHNLKYYTWVEQQGKSVEALNAQLDEGWWIAHQEKAHEVNAKLKALR